MGRTWTELQEVAADRRAWHELVEDLCPNGGWKGSGSIYHYSSQLMGWFGSFQIMFHKCSLGCSHPVTHTPMTVSLLHAHAMNVSCGQSDLFFKHFATWKKQATFASLVCYLLQLPSCPQYTVHLPFLRVFSGLPLLRLSYCFQRKDLLVILNVYSNQHQSCPHPLIHWSSLHELQTGDIVLPFSAP